SDSPERGYLPHLCKGCGTCVECCPQNALSFTDKPLPLVEVDKKLCISCFTCVAECPQEAVKGFGKKMTVHEVVHEIEKDEVFYFHSKGGVTISGGECLQQALFVQGILQECRKRSIETAIETTLFAPWKKIESLLPYLNHVYADIKHGDPGLHRTYTGVDNQLIHKNLHRLDSMTAPLSIHVRIPLIPGINDSDESLLAML
ncbi:MAG: glycyl-radical enzyme activating protein, partial [Desulfobacterales bacterium]|nr:glycyl-radical enzyme activating protein [Desulfobacterales bacterium]